MHRRQPAAWQRVLEAHLAPLNLNAPLGGARIGEASAAVCVPVDESMRAVNAALGSARRLPQAKASRLRSQGMRTPRQVRGLPRPPEAYR